MTDIQGAIGREQVRRLDTIITRRRELAARYTEMLGGLPGVTPPVEPPWARSNWQSYIIRLDKHLDQREVMQQLLDEGVSTRRGVMCIHHEPAYPAGSWRWGPQGLRHSEEAQDRTVILPLYPWMSDEDQDYVVEALERAVGR